MGRGWKGVDLDGTLAEYKGWKGATVIGKPVPEMLNRVKDWLAKGQNVKIFTARVNPKSRDAEAARLAIKEWCVTYLDQELEITHEKDYDMIELWDDRAIPVVRNTGRIGVNLTNEEEET